MQSRLATKFTKVVVAASTRNKYLPERRLCGVSTGRTAEPEEHATEPGDTYPEERPKGTPTKEEPPIKEHDPFVSSKQPSHTSSSPKIESNAVNNPSGPIHQQRRKYAANSTAAPPLTDVSCAGMDGTPWPQDNMDRRSQIKKRVEDDKEYYEHHKASPLSEMEMSDTRKPITRATDGTAGSGGYFGGDSGVIVWRPEQLDTAEDSLLRAKMIWEQNAMRGDPDSPHGRVLRALRGEFW